MHKKMLNQSLVGIGEGATLSAVGVCLGPRRLIVTTSQVIVPGQPVVSVRAFGDAFEFEGALAHVFVWESCSDIAVLGRQPDEAGDIFSHSYDRLLCDRRGAGFVCALPLERPLNVHMVTRNGSWVTGTMIVHDQMNPRLLVLRNDARCLSAVMPGSPVVDDDNNVVGIVSSAHSGTAEVHITRTTALPFWVLKMLTTDCKGIHISESNCFTD